MRLNPCIIGFAVNRPKTITQTASEKPPHESGSDGRQIIKWIVYTLLLVNWAFYLMDEYAMAEHTLRHGGSLLDWTMAFGTSIDELAWFGLLFIFELETWALSEEALAGWHGKVLQGLKLVCYVFLAHTVFAWGTNLADLRSLEIAAEIDNVCQLADQDISFTRNLEYTIISSENCKEFSTESVFFLLEPTVVTDESGFRQENVSAWFDLQDAITWLLVVLSIELAVHLQDRGITGGRLMLVSHAAKFFYAILLLDAGFWAWNGHWLYTWDQLLWIGGFMAIEMNVSEWRDDLLGKKSTTGEGNYAGSV